MVKRTRYATEVRQRAVRLVFEHEKEYESQWAAIRSIASKIGCSAETLRKWVRQAERDQGCREGLTTEDRERLKVLERENRELRRANEILRKASAYFAQAELDRRQKVWSHSLMSTGRSTGSGRCAQYCRSPHRPTTNRRHDKQILNEFPSGFNVIGS